MTKIAIIAATQREIDPVVSYFGNRFIYSVSGVGGVASAICTMQTIVQHQPHLVLGVGIAGAVDRTLEIGQAVIVSRDYMADLGAWRGEQFHLLESQVVDYPYVVEGFLSVTARTVNSACATYIHDNSQIETMEGAAFMLAARAMGIRFMQLRTISNYVDQPRGDWRVDDAIAALPHSIATLLKGC